MIRWITEQLGTAAFDRVPRGDYAVVDVRDLVDKAGNSELMLVRHVDHAVSLLRSGRRVVIACDYGISRSNAIAAGALSRLNELSINDALQEVIRTTGEKEIKIEVFDAVRRVLYGGACDRKASRVLITGGSGFIGSALVARLSAVDISFVVPTRTDFDLNAAPTILSAYLELNEIATILHLAHPRRFTDSDSVGEHVSAVRKLLELTKAASAKLIYLSSWTVFQGAPMSLFEAEEQSRQMPQGVYSETKYLGERLIELHRNRGDVQASICRLSNIYGPGGGRPRFIRAFADRIMSNQPVTTHRYRNVRPALDLLYIDDAIDGLVRLLEKDDVVDMHFGSGVVVATDAIAREIATLLHREVEILTHEIDAPITNVSFPATRARELLNWKPKVDLTAGLVATLGLDPEPLRVNSQP